MARLAEIAAYALARLLPTRFMCSKRLFPIWERAGFHVTPVHFYEPVPDTANLAIAWDSPSHLVGIDLRVKEQIELVSRLRSRYRVEYESLGRDQTVSGFSLANGRFEAVDAEILYALIRDLMPKQVIEVGSGYSTLLLQHALHRNGRGHLTTIDPFPHELADQKGEGRFDVIRRRVQEVPFELFESLGAGDVLFVDSSHVLSIGSDVQYELLEVIPRLAPGVFVHFHDVFLPFHYPRRWVLEEFRFWNEQYALQAFLSFNAAFEIVWCGSYMNFKHPEVLTEAFSSYHRGATAPGSCWIRRLESADTGRD